MAPRRLSGPVQRGAIKVLLEMGVASTSDIMPYTHATQLNAQYRSRSLRRVLDEIAIRVGPRRRPGHPGSLAAQARIRKITISRLAAASPFEHGAVGL
jgi:hypothetical protein